VDPPTVRRIWGSLLVGCLLTVAGVLVASPASACSCAGAMTKEHLDGADAVFIGTLVSRTVTHPDSHVQSSGDPALHVFAVDEVFTGDVHELQGVLSADSGASCGLELSGKGPFVVFATRPPGGGATLTASLCGGTAPVDAALTADLRGLAGPPADPQPGDDVPSVAAAGLGTSWVAALAAAGALLLLGFIVVRRRIPTHR
jgi:hypothetical protein